MKLLITFLLLSSVSFGQSKKDQIITLKTSIDSLNTSIDSLNTVLATTRDNSTKDISSLNDKIKEISDEVTALKSDLTNLQSSNTNLTKENDKLKTDLAELSKKNLELADSLKNQVFLFSLVNGTISWGDWLSYEYDRDSWEEAFPNLEFDTKYRPSVEVGLYYQGKTLLIDENQDAQLWVAALPEEPEEPLIYQQKKGKNHNRELKIDVKNSVKTYSIEKINNTLHLIVAGGDEYWKVPVSVFMIEVDLHNNLNLKLIFSAIVRPPIDEPYSVDCTFGDCDYIYLKDRYDK